jgi:hypothetical protein
MSSTVKIETSFVAGWLSELAAASGYVGAMIADPFTVMDPLTVEVDGYSRAPVVWDIATRTMAPTSDLLLAGVPSGVTIVAFAGFDTVYSGTMAWALLLEEDDQIVTSSYGNVTVDADELVLGFGPT